MVSPAAPLSIANCMLLIGKPVDPLLLALPAVSITHILLGTTVVNLDIGLAAPTLSTTLTA